MDVTDLGPFTLVQCPDCQREVRVKTEVGPYRLDRRLAIGGMSVVFVARDETLGREVVVKLLTEEYSGDEKRTLQFEKEAEMTASVSHPNVVRVYTVGRAFERFYIAMEYVDGESLEVKMEKEGALPESVVLPMALQVVDGLAAAQRAGLIHRDIKPGNILIDGKGTAKIVDFGLSLLTEGGSVTAEEIWATPYYVPPEALEYEDEDLRSDIYALGATLYHALAGKPPIKTKEMATAVLREEKRKVPSLRRMAPWLRTETVAAVEKAMALSREDRFSSYGEFRNALEEARSGLLREGDGMPEHGKGRMERRQLEVARRKMWMAVGVGAGALILLACAVSYLLAKAGRNKWDAVADGGGGSTLVIDRAAILDPVVATEISQAYEEAREALGDNDYVLAEKKFRAVWDHAGAPARTAGWAGFEVALACYLDGRPGDGRDQLRRLGVFLKEKKEEETELGKNLRRAIKMLRALEMVPEDQLSQVLEEPFRATIYFAVGVKLWEQGQLARAAGMFERFRKAGPWEGAEWMGIYQGIAEGYARDFGRLNAADHETGGKTAEELREAIARLEETYLTLQTRGRARFNVKVWQTEMVRKIHELREVPARSGGSAWQGSMGAAAELFLAGAFPEAAERLRAIKLSEKAELEQREMLVWLADTAGVFLQEVERRLAAGDPTVEIATKGGEKFQGVLGSGGQGIMVSDGDAARVLGWAEVRPESLLAAMDGWLPEGAEQESERRRLLTASAAYAALSGKLETADGIAEGLGAEDERFALGWAEMKRRLRR